MINQQASISFISIIFNLKCKTLNQNFILKIFRVASVKILGFKLFVFCSVLPHTGNKGTKHLPAFQTTTCVMLWYCYTSTCSFSSKSMFCFLSWTLAFSSLSSLSESSDGGGASDSSSCRTWYSTSYACSCLEMSISIACKPHFILIVIFREYGRGSLKLNAIWDSHTYLYIKYIQI